MHKKILITGITGFRNHGVQALVLGIVAGVRERFAGAQVDLMTDDAKYDAAVAPDLADTYIQDPWRRKTLGLKRDLMLRGSKWIKSLDKRGNFIQNYDLVVVSGGDMFGPDYNSFEEDLEPLRAARSFGVPYVFIGQSVGRFKDSKRSESFVGVAKDATLFAVRETLTMKYLSEELGLSESQLVLASDPAFLLQPTAPSKRLVDLIVGDSSEPYVAISVSQGISQFSGSDVSLHENALVRLVDYFNCKVGIRVLLVPHVHESYLWNDDSWLAQQVGKKCKAPAMTSVAPVHLSANDYKALIGAAEFCVAERMHAAIAALSSGVPVFCIGYSVKYRGILGDIFGLKQTEESLLISVGDFVESDAVPAPIKDAWKNRTSIRASLAEKLDELKDSAKTIYDKLP